MVEFGESIRVDFPSIHLPQDTLIEVNKRIGEVRHIGEKKARPDACSICGESNRSFCSSHSIPQFCLREIAHKGKLRTINSSIKVDFMRREVGINRAGIFKMVCRECDNAFFADYENPENYVDGTDLDAKLLGEIAFKVCLLEQYKARVEIATLNEAHKRSGISGGFINTVDARSMDLIDDEFQLGCARDALLGKGSGYRVLFDASLEHTAPITFQGQIALASDFEGKMINDIYNPSSDYHIEPVFVCVFPLRQGTRVFMFCRDAGYARFSRFHRQIRSLSQSRAFLSIVKIMLAYSEEIYFSPLLPDSVFEDDSFSLLARWSNIRLLLSDESLRRRRKQVCSECALNSLPDPPNLLSKEYSMSRLREAV